MAFGVSRQELTVWKQAVRSGELAYLTHYWQDNRFPYVRTVTKVGCTDLSRLIAWCEEYGLPSQYIHNRQPYPHFDLIGPRQLEILRHAGQIEQITRFRLEEQPAMPFPPE